MEFDKGENDSYDGYTFSIDEFFSKGQKRILSASRLFRAHRIQRLTYANFAVRTKKFSGAVLHMVNIHLAPEHLIYIINHAKDEILLVDDDLLPIIEEIYISLIDHGMRIINENGEVPWDGKTMGELMIRGPLVADEYYEDERTADAFRDGWLYTGDIAVRTPQGYIKIPDRTKDLIKSGGEWISSVDLENTLMRHDAVFEAAVIAVPHPKWWLPDDFLFLDEIPKTSVGKFLKAKLRDEINEYI